MVIENLYLEQPDGAFNQFQAAHGPTPIKTKAMRVAIFKEEQAVGEVAAAVLAEDARQNPASVWLLPTGRTPLVMYTELVKIIEQQEVKLSGITTFNLDEFYGLAAQHP